MWANAARALDESLLLDVHRGICGDLTPGWAGRFRDADVRVDFVIEGGKPETLRSPWRGQDCVVRLRRE